MIIHHRPSASNHYRKQNLHFENHRILNQVSFCAEPLSVQCRSWTKIKAVHGYFPSQYWHHEIIGVCFTLAVLLKRQCLSTKGHSKSANIIVFILQTAKV